MKLNRIVAVIGALLALGSPASAQSGCGGQAPSLTFCGNTSGSTGLPSFKPIAAFPLTVGSTPILGGTTTAPLFDNAGVLGNGLISSTWSTFLAAGTGAATRTAQNKMRDAINAKDYGAICPGTGDVDRLGIQAAIDANPGAIVGIPASTCIVTRTPAQPYGIIINNGTSLVGLGAYAAIRPDVTFPTNADVVYIVPTAAVSWSGFSVTTLIIGDGVHGRDAVRVDTQTAGNNGFLNTQWYGDSFQGVTANGGYGFHHINNATNNINGGFFSSTLGPNNVYLGGIYLENSGDSINIIGGEAALGSSIRAKLVPGAFGPFISGVNVTSAGGIQVDCGSFTIIGPGNTIEAGVISTNANNSVIDLNGSTCTIANPWVVGNNISNSLIGQSPTLVRGGFTTNLNVSRNRFTVQSDYIPIVLTNNSTTALVGADNIFVNVSGVVTTPVTPGAGGTLQTLTTGYGPTVLGIPYMSDRFNLTFTAAMTNGQLLVGQTSSAPLPKTMSGDATLAASGALTIGAGAVTNSKLANSATTVNGQTCMLGSTCTITAAATSVAVGTTTITGGTTLGVLYNNAGVLGNTAAGTNGQLILGVTSAAPVFATMSGSATITNTGVVTLSSVITGTTVGAATNTPVLTFGNDGRLTTVTSVTVTPAVGSITGLGTGVAAALGVNVGSAGAFVVNGGALGTPSSGTLTSATGLPISTGLTGTGTGVLTALAVNVGSAGAFVTFNGALGTPSSGVATNLTGTASGLTAGNVTTNANLTGPVTSVGNATTISSVITGATIGSATNTPVLTYGNDGRLTTVTSVTVTPAIGSVTGLGTGVATALGVNVGTAGAFVVNGGALGTPSSGIATNLTGTASGLTAGSVTTNANLTGVITSVGNATSIASQTGTGTTFVTSVAPTITGTTTLTTLAVTTINAFTLGGTISGGGNQLNNIIIGTTTPLAGAFTTVTASTSVTSPIHAGGSTASSTLTLESTSGAGTTDAIAFQTASQVYRGGISTGGLWTIGPNVTPNSGTLLTINANTVAPPAATFSGTLLQIAGADTTANRVVLDAFGANSSIGFRRSNGTAASPTQVTSGQSLGAFLFEGRDTAGYDTSDAASVTAAAAETFTTTAHGTDIYIAPIPKTTLLSARSATFNASGGVWVGATNTDKGQNNLGVQGQVYIPNITADTATADSTVCSKTADGQLLKGTGTLGICLGTSSIRYKQDVFAMGAGLAEVIRLQPKNFFYKKGWGDDNKRLQYGLIAEDVVKVLPGITSPDADGKPQSVDMLALVPVLVNAVKQLKADNDNLASEIVKLKAAR